MYCTQLSRFYRKSAYNVIFASEVWLKVELHPWLFGWLTVRSQWFNLHKLSPITWLHPSNVTQVCPWHQTAVVSTLSQWKRRANIGKWRLSRVWGALYRSSPSWRDDNVRTEYPRHLNERFSVLWATKSVWLPFSLCDHTQQTGVDDGRVNLTDQLRIWQKVTFTQDQQLAASSWTWFQSSSVGSSSLGNLVVHFPAAFSRRTVRICILYVCPQPTTILIIHVLYVQYSNFATAVDLHVGGTYSTIQYTQQPLIWIPPWASLRSCWRRLGIRHKPETYLLGRRTTTSLCFVPEGEIGAFSVATFHLYEMHT